MRPFLAAQRSTALALALSGWSSTSVGANCRVEVVGRISLAWQEAVHSLSLAGLTDGDCARIEVDVTGDVAALTFITADGRRAERKLRNPDELAPTIAALRVTGPPAVAPPPESQPARSETPVPAPVTPSNLGERTPERASLDGAALGRSDRELRIVFALQGGARGGADLRAQAMLSPALDGSAALVLRRWELGVTAAWESHYYRLGSDELSSKESGAVALGVGVGRREPLGGIDLLAGGRLSVAVLDRYETSWSGPADAVAPDDGRSTPAEWRVGPYVGVVLPRSAAIRFRADLRADIVAQSLVDGGPVTPAWGIAGVLGIEASAR